MKLNKEETMQQETHTRGFFDWDEKEEVEEEKTRKEKEEVSFPYQKWVVE